MRQGTPGISWALLVVLIVGLVAGSPEAWSQTGYSPPAALNTNAATDSGADNRPQVTSDGAGNWVAVWASSEASIGAGIGTDFDILVSRSTDNGATWTPPAALNTNAATDSGDDRSPQVTTDGAGNWVAVWDSNESAIGTGIGTDYDILVSRSTDNGATWTTPNPLETSAATDSLGDRSPQVTTDGAGNWVAVWLSEEPIGMFTRWDTRAGRSTDNGATWTTHAIPGGSLSSSSHLQVTTDGGGNWIAVRRISDVFSSDSDILVSRSTDNGATWTGNNYLNTNADTDTGDDSYPQVTTDGAGNWVAVWDSAEPSIGAGIGTDADILISRSADNGATWTAPAALNSNASSDSGADWEPQVTTDAAGNWVAVWCSYEANIGPGIGTDFDILVSRSADNGVTWTPPVAFNTNAATDTSDDSYPQVTTDGAGHWLAVWTSSESTIGPGIGTDRDILVSVMPPPSGFALPVALNTNAGSDSGHDAGAQVTTDRAGNWVAVWNSEEPGIGSGIGTDHDILVARSADNGATWTAPAALNTNAGSDSGNDYSPQVTTDSAGNWVAVWESSEFNIGPGIGTDRDILVARSTDNGATWSAPAALNTNAATDSGADWGSQVTTDSAGNWVAVWRSYEPNIGAGIGTDWDILVSRSTDIGVTWTAPAALNTNAGTDTGYDFNPQVTTDGAGNWVAVWLSAEPSIGPGIGTDSDILVSRSTDNGANWTAPAALNTSAATDSGGDSSPQVTTDRAGTWLAVWQSSEPSIGTGIGTDYDILGARSTDNGLTWTAPAVLNTNAATDAGDDYRPQVTTDGAGNWVAVWESSEPSIGPGIGTDYDILVSYSADNGTTWTAPTVLNTNADTDSGEDSFSQVTTDGAGNWLAVWQSDEPNIGSGIGTDSDILVFVMPPPSGFSPPVALNTNADTDTYGDYYTQVTTDGAGNWVAVWNTMEPNIGAGIGTDDDILVSRSADNGVTWTAPAALNTNADTDSSEDSSPHVTTDGAGNWIAVWLSDEPNIGVGIGTDYDILVARSTDNGATWTPPAALNTNAGSDSGGDFDPQVTTDGAGNWVAVWHSSEPNIGASIGTDVDILVSRSTDNGANWTAPAALNSNASSDSGADYGQQVTTDAAGNWVAVWYSYESNIGSGIGTDWDILVARSTDNGVTWTAPAALNTNAASDSGSDGSAQVTTDRAGNWVAVWNSSEPTIGAGIGTDRDILVVCSTDNGATWTAPATLNGNADADSGNDRQPQVTTDGVGNWTAVWFSDEPNIGAGIGADYDILVARSTDNGATWTPPAALNSYAGSDSATDVDPQVMTDDAGNWLAVWQSNEPNIGSGISGDHDILFSRSTDIAPLWTAPTATSIAPASPNPTNAASVDYFVVFDAAVSGVDASDFTLTTSGLAGASVSSVSALSGNAYTVAVSTGTGDGTLRLDLVDDDSIANIYGLPLGSAGAGNGDRTGDGTYIVDKTPVTIAIGPPSQSSTASGPVTYTITYSGADTVSLSVSDITLNTTDTATGSVAVSGSGLDTRTVTVSGITGTGEIGISVAAGTASDVWGDAPAVGPSTAFTVTGGVINDTYVSTDVPVTISDWAVITSTIDIPSLGAIQGITDVNVTLDISHTRDEDLEAYLISPQGTKVNLFIFVGGIGDNFTNTTLDDSAATSIAVGSAPFTGTYRPEGSLADYIDESSIGTWTLTIIDTWSGNTGTLNSWSLDITGTESPALPASRLLGLALAAAALAAAGAIALRRMQNRRSGNKA